MYSRIWETITGKNQEPEVAQASEKPENTDSSYSRLYQGRLKQNKPTSSSQYLSRNSQINMLKTLSFMMGIIHIITRVGAGKTYFYDHSNNSDYLYDSSTSAFNRFGAQINNGVCGIDPSIPTSEISANYIRIKSWNGDYAPKHRAALYRGAGDPTNTTLEECFINLISSFNEVYEETLMNNSIAKEAESDKHDAIVFGVFGGFMLSVCLLFTGVLFILNRKNPDHTVAELNKSDEEHSLHPLEKPSHHEQLEKISYQGEIPERFICPISHVIMDDPQIIDDGHSYDKTSIDALLANNSEAACPLNRDKLITQRIPNYDLKSDIDEFVTDILHQKKASNEPKSCRSSSDRSSDDVAISMPSPRM